MKFIRSVAAVAFTTIAASLQAAELRWIDGRELPLEGRGFETVEAYFDRLPADLSPEINQEVHRLKHNAAGLQFRFRTTSTQLVFCWENTDPVLAYPNLSAMGASGIDVYRRRPGTPWTYLATGRVEEGKDNKLSVAWTPGDECLVYLPTYNGIRSFRLGVDGTSEVLPLPVRSNGCIKPVVFYGTSITQGASCSRPGLAYPSVVGRELDVPIVNLGFSGSGKGELAMADCLASVDASCYVIDILWNMDESALSSRYAAFVRRLRQVRPEVPIVLLEGCDVHHGAAAGQLIQKRNEVVRKIWREFESEGVQGLVFLRSEALLPGDEEGTADGVHPNDHGMAQLAKAVTSAVREAFGSTTHQDRYSVSVPIINADLNRYGGGEAVVGQLRRFDAKRVFLACDRYYVDAEANRAETMRLLAENCRFLKSRRFEVAAWNWTFWCAGKLPFGPMTAADGWKSDHVACPLDPAFRKMAAAYVQDFARAGVDMIVFDDDCRYWYHTPHLVCTCPRHMIRYRQELGEEIAPKDLQEKAFMGGPNRYRAAVLKVRGEALLEFASEMRSAVDAVNPRVRLGQCAVMSLWDADGVDAATISRTLAGKTRPFLRLIGAPYWAVERSYVGGRLQNVIEFERMERSWCGDDIEIIAEGDSYPRPRWRCPASYLELFDLALRADGGVDGILKYGIDYYSPVDYETGYAERHERNRTIYAAVERLFSGKRPAGVRVYETLHKLADAEIPEALRGTTAYADSLFASPAAMLMSDCGIPTQYDGDGVCAVAFGENVKAVPVNAYRKGLILDLSAARILKRRGVDIGLQEIGPETDVTDELFEDGRVLINQNVFRACRLKLDARAEVVSSFVKNDTFLRLSDDRFPAAYRYVNAKGERFFVLAYDAYVNKSDGMRRSTARSRQLREAVRWLAGRDLPAYAGGHPDCYLMAKRGEKALAVGLWNLFADEMLAPVVELDEPYASVEFINCSGRVEGNRVYLTDIAPYSFVGFEVRK